MGGGARRRAVLAGSVLLVAVGASCADDGSFRRSADVTISVAYDGHREATVTVQSGTALSADAAGRVIRDTAQRMLATHESVTVARTRADAFRASFTSVGLRGTMRIDGRPVLADTRRILGLSANQTVWLGVCIPQSRARWSFPRTGPATSDHGCNAWFGDDPSPMYLHLGHIFNGTFIPIGLLLVLTPGAIAAFPLFRTRGHGLLIGLLCVLGIAVALFDALVLTALRSGSFLANDPMAVFGMDPDASLHRLQSIGAIFAVGVALVYFLIVVSIGIAAWHARDRAVIDARALT